MRELIQATCRSCERRCDALVIHGWFIFWNSQDGCTSFSASAMNRSTFSRSNIAELRRLKYFFEDGDLEAVVSQADRKQLHRALRFESPRNGRPSMVR
jgi:hypothetical protein